MKKIYLDNAATTKPSEEVILAMDAVLRESWGNPSSIHQVGQAAHSVLDEGRRVVAEFLNCEATEVIFTSGGSESDNLAIRGLIQAEGGRLKAEGLKSHVVTSATEHHAVLHTVQELEKEGLIEATYLKPDSSGLISVEKVEKAIKDNTVLVSIIYVNNETGVVSPIAEIGKMLSTGKKSQKIFFHTDAVQAAEWLLMDVEKLGVDLLTFTAHKLHGPKGIGVLYTKKGTPLKHQIAGGDQEFRLRAGTENVSAIAGFARAIAEVKSSKLKAKSNVVSLCDRLIAGIMSSIPDAILNGEKAARAPHIVNISFLNAEGEAIILNLDFLGIQVSSGSACTSRSLNPSHVLSAMGIPPEKAHGSIRFSLSRETTEEEIDRVLEVLPPIIEKLRAMSPFK
ncbi:MAG: cysteine desulfurase family protein [Candidatus Berkelbacteria bacterium]|nr:cysteine desulfurase family protein [Candidatus Berkelbacteria bacterium]